ncbi:MAG: amidohydrolase, partial [Candidatus Kariarchaeaceae archaeon]
FFDLDKRVLLPGLHDAHLHVYSIGRGRYRLQLNKPKSIAEMQNRLLDYIDRENDDNWIIGHDWDQDYMEDKRYPNKSDLDVINNERPIVLFRSCHHIGLVNSKALERLRIDIKTNDPSGGKIDRDNNGEATGILRENALSLVTPYITITDKEKRKKIFELGLKQCLSVGLTGVQTNDADAWEIYQELNEEGKLPIRVSLTPPHRELDSGNLPLPRSRIGKLSCDRVKLFVDGSLGAHTAALREPYSDTKIQGISIYSQDQINEKVKFAKEKGYRLEVHAIGDLAADITIKAFDYADLNIEDRPILTHCQVLAKDLLQKMSERGIIANIQPPFVTTDSQWVEKRLGRSERLQFSYAWKKIIDHGIPASGGSDAPIENPNPLLGIYAAMFRKDAEDKVWMPQERLTFEEAIHLYTQGAAFANYSEDVLGRLAPGFKADFIVLDRDILHDFETLPQAKIEQVWVDGIRQL